MQPKLLTFVAFLRRGQRPSTGRRRARSRPNLEILDRRLTPSTYTWTGGGDGLSWNDPNNWEHRVPTTPFEATGTPTAYSNVVFPAYSPALPVGTSKTINFNFNGFNFPVNSLTVEDAYTFTGNSIEIDNLLATTNSYAIAFGPANATFLLSGMTLGAGATINTDSGSTVQISNAGNTSGLQLNFQNGVSKTGPGQLVIDTPSITYPTGPNFQPIPLDISGGTLTLGASVNLPGVNLATGPYSTVTIADGVAAKLGAITGSGLVNLDGTTVAGDQTSLTVVVNPAVTDQFGGSIQGIGQFIVAGYGTLTTGAINLGGTSTIEVLTGTLNVNGSISAGGLEVNTSGTLGGLGSWQFSGPVVFQAGSTFAVTLNGTIAGLQYTQLVDTDTTSGVNLGYSILAGSTGYEYQQGDQYQIISSPVIQNSFQNVVNGNAILNGDIPFQVGYGSTSVLLTALQSVTTTQLVGSGTPSNPGQPVTFTATVNSRTAPVTSGTVSFQQGSTVLAVVPLNGAGTASFTTTTLPLGTTKIIAVYSGAGANRGSTSDTVTQLVIPYTTLTSLLSSANPVWWGQPVTFTATVTAKGLPVTSGTVTFTQGKVHLGTVSLNAAGTASFTLPSLSPGKVKIQALYSGVPNNQSSASPVLTQVVTAVPTTTSLIVTTPIPPNGRSRIILIAMVAAEGSDSLIPSGTVVFRQNGVSVGKAKLRNGTAVLVLGRKAKRNRAFVAAFQGSSRFKGSMSAPVRLQA
jgi:Bacterial Ig-like domain (group 3)